MTDKEFRDCVIKVYEGRNATADLISNNLIMMDDIEAFSDMEFLERVIKDTRNPYFHWNTGIKYMNLTREWLDLDPEKIKIAREYHRKEMAKYISDQMDYVSYLDEGPLKNPEWIKIIDEYKKEITNGRSEGTSESTEHDTEGAC